MSSTIYAPLEEREADRRELWRAPRICTMLQHPLMDAQKRVPQDFTQKVAEGQGIDEHQIEIWKLDSHKAPLVRLLVVDPGSGDEIIRCMLEQHDLRRKPHFEALSYCWGDPANKELIICRRETMEDGMTISVGRNLEVALKRLRYSDQKRVLWVDALCINQEDNPEKGSQVKMMDYIYSCADRVLVWLGEEEARDCFAIEAINKTHEYINTLYYNGNLQDTMSKIINNPDLPYNAWQQIGAFFRRPYFQRLWVIQEVVQSKSVEVLCGDKTISWDSMHTIVNLFSPGPLLSASSPEFRRAAYLPDPNESNIHLIQSLLDTKSGPHPGKPFFDIVLQAQTFQSTMARDKLFALVNLAWVEDRWIPRPNYQCSDLEVFRTFVLLDVVENKSTKALSWVNTASVNRNSGDPFWVPTIADFKGPKPSFFMERGRPFDQIQRLPKSVASINETKTTLTIKGQLLRSPVAVIASSRSALYQEAGLALPLRPADFTEATVEVERTWLWSCFQAFLESKSKILMEHSNTEIGNDDSLNSDLDVELLRSTYNALINSDHFVTFILILTCNWNSYACKPITPWIPPWTATSTNASSDGSSGSLKDSGFYKIPNKAESDGTPKLPEDQSLLEYLQDVVKFVIGGYTLSSAHWDDYLNTIPHEYTKWRTFCGLEDGRIGWAPNNVRSGDRVCVFTGGRESFLLRATSDENDDKNQEWELHGECYFEGLELGGEYLTENDGFEELQLRLI